ANIAATQQFFKLGEAADERVPGALVIPLALLLQRDACNTAAVWRETGENNAGSEALAQFACQPVDGFAGSASADHGTVLQDFDHLRSQADRELTDKCRH